MAEDALFSIGFNFFNDRGKAPTIASEQAVFQTEDVLFNDIAFQNANLGNAVEAVQTAARNKAARDVGQEPDIPFFDEGVDFFLI